MSDETDDQAAGAPKEMAPEGARDAGSVGTAHQTETGSRPGTGPQRSQQEGVAGIAHPEPDAPSRPERVLLHAVQVLHERGYERLRINPTFYATGHWRCSLRSGRRGEVVHLRYTNGRGWDVLGDGRQDRVTATELADRLERACPDLERARGADAGYRFWYAALLEHCGPDAVPFLYDDYSSPLEEGRVGITGHRGVGLLSDSFPLPPG